MNCIPEQAQPSCNHHAKAAIVAPNPHDDWDRLPEGSLTTVFDIVVGINILKDSKKST